MGSLQRLTTTARVSLQSGAEQNIGVVIMLVVIGFNLYHICIFLTRFHFSGSYPAKMPMESKWSLVGQTSRSYSGEARFSI